MANETASLFGFDDHRVGGGETGVRTGGDDRSQPRLRMLKLSQIEINPNHPRTVILEEDIATLATDIKQRGVQKPVVVQRIRKTYQYLLIDGGLRIRAAQNLGLQEIPAHVIKCDDSRLVYMVLELTHKALHPVDFAESITVVAEKWDGREGELAEVLNKQQSHISRSRRIASLSSTVKSAMRRQSMSFSVAYEISDDAFTDETRLELLEKAPTELTTERLRAEIRKLDRKPVSKPVVVAAKVLLGAVRRLVTWLRKNGEAGEPLDLSLRTVVARLEAVIRDSDASA